VLKAQTIGNIGNDPELRHAASGTPVLSFNVASNGRTRNQSGEWIDQTTWVRVTVLGRRAETLAQHLKKGSRVFVSGKLEARPWTDQQGQIRAGLEVLADDVEFASQQQSDDDQPSHPRGVNDRRDQPADRAAVGAYADESSLRF
jgi:single-strand DNA-binding protein